VVTASRAEIYHHRIVSLHIAVLMDPIERTYPGETTHAIGREAARRGHRLVYATPFDLAYEAPAVTARVRPLTYGEIPDTGAPPARGVGLGIAIGAPEVIDLATMDVVLMRQDPPVDASYLAATYLLERLAGGKTLVVNDPRAVRDTAEKLSIVQFPELAPPTLVASDPARLAAFRERHGDVVVKQLFGKGGEGLYYVKRDDKNWNVIVEQIVAAGVPVMVQKFFDLPSKKVVVIDGVVRGALAIEPEPDDIRGNLDRGKRVTRADLDGEERAACERVARWLGERGLVFAVIDLLGPYVIETNVTSPGIVFYYNDLHATKLEVEIVDAIERRVARR
jgi:glutathione synthase